AWDVSPSEALYEVGPGESFTVEIKLSGTGDEISSLGLDFHFPDDLLQYDDKDFTGTLLEVWMFKDLSVLTANTLRIAGFTATGQITSPAEGNLVILHFTVREGVEGEAQFSIDGFTDGLSSASTSPATFKVKSASAVTPIHDIQYTEDPTGDSPLKNQIVTISGIVTSEHRGSNYNNGGISGGYFFMADASAPWSGIQVYFSDSTVAYGDSITITGKVEEYYNLTEITTVTEFIRHATQRPVPAPVVVTTADVDTNEAYEGCLVQVQNVTVSEINIGNYKNWTVDDGSGPVKIDTRAKYYFTPELNEPLKSVTGVVLFGYGEYTIAPAIAWDIVEGGKYTRIQRLQQVRNSDLLRTPIDTYSDTTYAGYAHPDTFTIKGVVTMPTGVSYAGAGIKFNLSEPEGGPWSAILSYNADSTAYPVLFEGDLIEMTGYVSEYRTAPSNMTEFFITSPINILDFGQPIPDPVYVKTGDLRVPVTAEQWGNVNVYIKDAQIVDNNLQYELFAVDDGSGSVMVDDDSDELYDFFGDNDVPPVGTMADSIRGWVYHHYGYYTDSTTYVLEPLYLSDLVWGVAPPTISNVQRDIVRPTSSDPVTITANVVSNLGVAEVALYYEAAAGVGYQKIVMNLESGDTYTCQIPEHENNSFVNYYIEASDNQGQMSTLPSDLTAQNFCYPVKDGELTIRDVQYTPWEIADSPFEGYQVEVTGVLTTDTLANNMYAAYAIQDAEAEYSGIFVFGIDVPLNRGDEIRVSGIVTDHNPDWEYKWGNNTVILADTFEVISTGNVVNAVQVYTGDLSMDSETAEAYEGVLIRFNEDNDANLVSLNRYDATFDDGSGPCLVDGDFMLSGDQYENSTFYINDDDGYLVAFGDTLYPGDQVDLVQGVFCYSFGSFKVSIRDKNDFGIKVGVNPHFEPVPLTYKLEQNYPNPFNPGTRIYFEIPQNHKIKLAIYNMLGQQVRTLIDEDYNAGFHIVNWDGFDDSGKALPSGIYFYRIKAGDFVASKKMLMVK
ncbi:T9SS type A sorting domain-containing protein, partial [candidate division KSB1 bacterium]|nr:T9SS type A sorting domain-containing protein [candidate division KSB1 bacterium]